MIIEYQSRGGERWNVTLNGRPVDGDVIGDSTCRHCGSLPLIYNFHHDAVYCPACNRWNEAACDDPLCSHCAGRPEPPLPALLQTASRGFLDSETVGPPESQVQFLKSTGAATVPFLSASFLRGGDLRLERLVSDTRLTRLPWDARAARALVRSRVAEVNFAWVLEVVWHDEPEVAVGYVPKEPSSWIHDAASLAFEGQGFEVGSDLMRNGPDEAETGPTGTVLHTRIALPREADLERVRLAMAALYAAVDNTRDQKAGAAPLSGKRWHVTAVLEV